MFSFDYSEIYLLERRTQICRLVQNLIRRSNTLQKKHQCVLYIYPIDR